MGQNGRSQAPPSRAASAMVVAGGTEPARA
jgi:hypothetical protein